MTASAMGPRIMMLKKTGDFKAGFAAAAFLAFAVFSGVVFWADIEAAVDRSEAAVGEQILYSITVKGETAARPELGDLSGFKVRSGGVSQSFSFINGAASSETSYSYILVPLKEGEFTIGPAEVKNGTGTIRSNSVIVKVHAAGAVSLPPKRKPSEQEDTAADLSKLVFVKMELNKNRAYVSEQLILTVKFYLSGGTRVSDIRYTLPDLSAFAVQDIGRETQGREIIEGVAYDVVQVKKALYPLKEGRIELAPCVFGCSVLLKRQGSRRGAVQDPFSFDSFFDDSFFGAGGSLYPIEAKSEPFPLDVRPLPAQASGLPVGSFSMDASVNESRVRAGDPVKVTTIFEGSGNMKAIREPRISIIGSVKDYPSESKIELLDFSGVLKGRAVFEKIIVPQEAGPLVIDEIEAAVFDPGREEVIILKKGPFKIEVTPAPREKVERFGPAQSETRYEQPFDKEQQARKPHEIRYIKLTMERRSCLGVGEGAGIRFLLACIVFLFAAPFCAKVWKSVKYGFIDSPFRKERKKQSRELNGCLSGMKKALREKNSIEFYSQGVKALRLAVSLNTKEPAGTSIELLQALRKANVSSDTISGVEKFLASADAVSFGAGGSPVLLPSGDYQAVIRAIKAIN